MSGRVVCARAPIGTISRLNQPFYLAATAIMVDARGRRCLWKRASVPASPRRPRFFLHRLSRIVDGTDRETLSSRSGRPFRAFPRVKSRAQGEESDLRRRRPRPPAEMHCPFAIAHSKIAHVSVRRYTHRRRVDGHGGAVSMAGIDAEASTEGAGRTGACEPSERTREEGDRYLHAAWPCCERWNVDGLTNCCLIRVFAKINHSAVSVSPLHSTALAA